MNPFLLFVTEILYRPVYNCIVLFLELFSGNLGWAIVFMTILVRLLLLQPSLASTKMQHSMQSLQPKMQEIQEKYKDDPKKLSQAMMDLLKKEGSGPLKGCLNVLIQIPVFIGLFFVIRKVATNTIPTQWLYSFFYFAKEYLTLDGINTVWLGIDLLATKNIVITVLAALFTYLQVKITTFVRPATPTVPGANPTDVHKMMNFMNIFLVFVMASFVYGTAGAIGLYIIVTSLFSIVQYLFQYRILFVSKLQVFLQKYKKLHK